MSGTRIVAWEQTAFVAAVTRNNIPMVQLLLEAGADVSTPATNGVARTALQAAVELGNLELVRIFLREGANASAPPAAEYGATALQATSIGGYVGIAHVLFENGADANAEPSEYEGRTALEGAAEHGQIGMLQLLLNAGAQIEGSGEAQYARAVKYAPNEGHHAARRLLEAHHSRQSATASQADSETDAFLTFTPDLDQCPLGENQHLRTPDRFSNILEALPDVDTSELEWPI